MIIVLKLQNYLHNFLNCADYQDYAPNGLQVAGQSEIVSICSAVSADKNTILKAIEQKAQALLVHHGYFWKNENPIITGIKRQRLKLLLENDINLLAYHLPLDAHLEIGNNACIGKKLNISQFFSHKVTNIPNLLYSGTLPNVVDAQTFLETLKKVFKHDVQHIKVQNNKISRIAWCSGAAQDFISKAHELGVDAFLSGEISERTFYEAQEMNINYYACGHHATERDGISKLGEHLAQKFKLDHTFIDSENFI